MFSLCLPIFVVLLSKDLPLKLIAQISQLCVISPFSDITLNLELTNMLYDLMSVRLKSLFAISK